MDMTLSHAWGFSWANDRGSHEKILGILEITHDFT